MPGESVLHPVIVVTLQDKKSGIATDIRARIVKPLGSPHGRGRHGTPCERQRR